MAQRSNDGKAYGKGRGKGRATDKGKGNGEYTGKGDTQQLRLAAVAAQADGDLVEIGANLDRFGGRQAEVLARAAAARVSRIVVTGCSVGRSQAAQRICEQWTGDAGFEHARRLLPDAISELESLGVRSLPSLTFTAGIHPHDARTCDGETVGILRGMAAHPQCVAIGECGLDYDRMNSPKDVQLRWFREQVRLAVELGKPLFLHERDCDAPRPRLGSLPELLAILGDLKVKPSRVCIHCFTGSREDLQEYVRRGFFIGLTGFVAKRGRGRRLRELLEQGLLPLNQLMLETDCPFMTPDMGLDPWELGLRKQRHAKPGHEMEPCALPVVCRVIAECIGMDPGAVAAATTSNAVRFFRLEEKDTAEYMHSGQPDYGQPSAGRPGSCQAAAATSQDEMLEAGNVEARRAAAKRIFHYVSGVLNKAFDEAQIDEYAGDIAQWSCGSPSFATACDALASAIAATMVPPRGLQVLVGLADQLPAHGVFVSARLPQALASNANRNTVAGRRWGR